MTIGERHSESAIEPDSNEAVELVIKGMVEERGDILYMPLVCLLHDEQGEEFHPAPMTLPIQKSDPS